MNITSSEAISAIREAVDLPEIDSPRKGFGLLTKFAAIRKKNNIGNRQKLPFVRVGSGQEV